MRKERITRSVLTFNFALREVVVRTIMPPRYWVRVSSVFFVNVTLRILTISGYVDWDGFQNRLSSYFLCERLVSRSFIFDFQIVINHIFMYLFLFGEEIQGKVVKYERPSIRSKFYVRL
jgi:hypothetical protein